MTASEEVIGRLQHGGTTAHADDLRRALLLAGYAPSAGIIRELVQRGNSQLVVSASKLRALLARIPT